MDGNCLFRSIAHQSPGIDKYYAMYGELAAAHIKSNESAFKGFVEEEFDGGFSIYLDRMAKHGVWGGHLELMALSAILSVKFCVLTETNETIQVNMNEDEEGIQILNLVYHRSRLHYFSTKKVTSSQPIFYKKEKTGES